MAKNNQKTKHARSALIAAPGGFAYRARAASACRARRA